MKNAWNVFWRAFARLINVLDKGTESLEDLADVCNLQTKTWKTDFEADLIKARKELES